MFSALLIVIVIACLLGMYFYIEEQKNSNSEALAAVGEKIEVIVLELDVENRKLSLGHKQLTENPWNKYENEFGLNLNQKVFSR